MGTPLDDIRITALTEELDAVVPRDEAIVASHREYKPFGYIINANQRGLLRLGVECLREGLFEDGTPAIDAEQLKYLSSGPFSSIVRLRRDDDLRVKAREAAPKPSARVKSAAARRFEVLLLVGSSAVVVCGVVGAFTLFKSFLGLIF